MALATASKVNALSKSSLATAKWGSEKKDEVSWVRFAASGTKGSNVRVTSNQLPRQHGVPHQQIVRMQAIEPSVAVTSEQEDQGAEEDILANETSVTVLEAAAVAAGAETEMGSEEEAPALEEAGVFLSKTIITVMLWKVQHR